MQFWKNIQQLERHYNYYDDVNDDDGDNDNDDDGDDDVYF